MPYYSVRGTRRGDPQEATVEAHSLAEAQELADGAFRKGMRVEEHPGPKVGWPLICGATVLYILVNWPYA